MSHYTQLTIEQRYQISGLKKAGFNQSKIATALKVHKSTISRELKRNRGQRGWRPAQAHEKATGRWRGIVGASKFQLVGRVEHSETRHYLYRNTGSG